MTYGPIIPCHWYRCGFPATAQAVIPSPKLGGREAPSAPAHLSSRSPWL